MARSLFFLLALPAVVRAAARVAWLGRRLPLDEAADRLRRVPPFRLSVLRNPRWLAGSVERLLPLIPPWGWGPCLRRSLVLVDLLSRCGLEPRLHLGLRRRGGTPEGHAWVTVGTPADGEPVTTSLGYRDAFDF